MRDTINWTLRKKDGSTFGPVDTAKLRKWAAESRIVAGNEVSRDNRTWTVVEDIPDLEMNWLARRDDGKISGPFNVRAIPALLHHGVLNVDTLLEHTSNGQTLVVADVLEEMGIEVPRNDETQDTTDESDSEENEVNERLAEEAEALRGQLEEEKLLATQLQEDLEEQIASLQKELEAATEARPQLDEAETRIEELTKAGKQQGKQLKALEEKLTDLATTAAATSAERDGALEGAARLEQELEQQSQALKSAQDQLAETKTQLKARVGELEASLQEAADHRSQIEQAAAEKSEGLELALEQLEEFKQRAETAEQALEEQQEQIAEQTGRAKDKLHEMGDQLIFMRKNNASLRSEVDRLRMRFSRLLRASLIGLGTVVLALVMTAVTASISRQATESQSPADESGNGQESPSDQPAELPPPPEAGDLPPEDASGAPVTPPAPVQWPFISVRGIKQVSSGNELAVKFNEPVFASLARLGESGKRDLKAVAAQLKPALHNFTLIVEGHTDSDPVHGAGGFANNRALGKARADAAVAFLVESCDLPAENLQASSLGEAEPPFPNDTPENKKRNRTVVLKLQRRPPRD